MAEFEPVPFNASGSSSGFSITPQTLVADPFTESNITWTEVEASTSSDWAGFTITLSYGNNHVRGIFLVAIGAAASETIVAICPTSVDSTFTDFSIYVPVPIAAGTRVSVGASVAVATNTVTGQIVGSLSNTFDAEPTWTVMESGPYDLANDTATYGRWYIYDCGATAHTKGSWDSLSNTVGNSANNVLQGGNLANGYDWMGILWNKNWNTSQGNEYTLSDWGYGATPTIKFENVAVRFPNQEKGRSTVHWSPVSHAAGSDIQFRHQANSTDASDRLVGVLLFGLR